MNRAMNQAMLTWRADDGLPVVEPGVLVAAGTVEGDAVVAGLSGGSGAGTVVDGGRSDVVGAGIDVGAIVVATDRSITEPTSSDAARPDDNGNATSAVSRGAIVSRTRGRVLV